MLDLKNIKKYLSSLNIFTNGLYFTLIKKLFSMNIKSNLMSFLIILPMI